MGILELDHCQMHNRELMITKTVKKLIQLEMTPKAEFAISACWEKKLWFKGIQWKIEESTGWCYGVGSTRKWRGRYFTTEELDGAGGFNPSREWERRNSSLVGKEPSGQWRDIFHPVNPLLPKTHVFHHIQKGTLIYIVEDLRILFTKETHLSWPHPLSRRLLATKMLSVICLAMKNTIWVSKRV